MNLQARMLNVRSWACWIEPSSHSSKHSLTGASFLSCHCCTREIVPWAYDCTMYKSRNEVEFLFSRINVLLQFRENLMS